MDEERKLSLSRRELDEFPLEGLMMIASMLRLDETYPYTKWLESYYDPAKAALIDLLVDA